MIIDPYKYAVSSGYLLDSVTSALFAYSFRKLKTGVTQCCRIFRASDAAQLDIGFSGDVVDTAAIASHCSGTDGYLVRMYDQSGNANHTDALTPDGTEPLIYTGGAMKQVNSKSSFQLGTRMVKLPTGLWNSATDITLLMVLKAANAAGSNKGVFAPSTTNSSGLEVLQTKVIAIDTLMRMNGTNRTAGSNLLFGDDVQSLMEVYGNTSNIAAYYNNAAVTLSSSAAMPTLNFNGQYAIGGYDNTNVLTGGNWQEIIGYSADKSASRATIASNINSYYSIY